MELQKKEQHLRTLRDGIEVLNPVIDWPIKQWPKVLVVAPTYDGKIKDFEAYMSLITNLEYPNYDICIADNSENKGGAFFKKLASYAAGNAGKKEILQTRRAKTTRQSIAKSRNQLRDYFLKGDYDFMLSVEFDLLPPKTIIKDLMQYGAPVITAMYEIGYDHKKAHLTEAGKYPLIHLALREVITERKVGAFMDFICPSCKEHLFVNNRTKQLDREEVQHFVDGRVKRVHGCGMGCTLISRKALEAIDGFRVDLQYPYHDDTFFYMDLWNRNVPVYLHTGYNITHNNDDWQAIKDF